MIENLPYTSEFFKEREVSAERSAETIIPLLFNYYKPQSVVDVGCATGEWLNVFQKAGCDIKGYDGEYIFDNVANLKIPMESIEAKDLNKPMFDAHEVPPKFDLAVSLEVAEHLDPDRAEGFIQDLTKLSDVILFSAAIPWQVGTHHVNCQWQSFWANIFSKQGYVLYDCFRPILWNNEEVDMIYRNNMLLYVKELSDDPHVRSLHNKIPLISMPELDMVHKDFYLIVGVLMDIRNELTAQNKELMEQQQQIKERIVKLEKLLK